MISRGWVGFVASALAACTAQNQSSHLEISDLRPPTTAEALDAAGVAATCVFGTDGTASPLHTFNITRDFRIGVIVTNNLANNADLALGRLNTNDFYARQAVTTFETNDGSAVNIPQQVEPVQGLVPINSTEAIGAVIIPAAVAAQLALTSSVRVHVRIEGTLLDGSYASTNEYLAVLSPTTSDEDASSCVAGSGMTGGPSSSGGQSSGGAGGCTPTNAAVFFSKGWLYEQTSGAGCPTATFDVETCPGAAAANCSADATILVDVIGCGDELDETYLGCAGGQTFRATGSCSTIVLTCEVSASDSLGCAFTGASCGGSQAVENSHGSAH